MFDYKCLIINYKLFHGGSFYLLLLTPDICIYIQFFATRGVPTLIITDNGSQFISNVTESFVNSGGTKWQFNLPSALC